MKEDITWYEIIKGIAISIFVGYLWHIGKESFIIGWLFFVLWTLVIRQRNQINP